MKRVSVSQYYLLNGKSLWLLGDIDHSELVFDVEHPSTDNMQHAKSMEKNELNRSERTDAILILFFSCCHWHWLTSITQDESEACMCVRDNYSMKFERREEKFIVGPMSRRQLSYTTFFRHLGAGDIHCALLNYSIHSLFTCILCAAFVESFMRTSIHCSQLMRFNATHFYPRILNERADVIIICLIERLLFIWIDCHVSVCMSFHYTRHLSIVANAIVPTSHQWHITVIAVVPFCAHIWQNCASEFWML